jgi:hypothetical protein
MTKRHGKAGARASTGESGSSGAITLNKEVCVIALPRSRDTI